MPVNTLINTTKISECSKAAPNLCVYLLEAQYPDAKILVAHFLDLSFIAVPTHGLILWDDEQAVSSLAVSIANHWQELEFNADAMLLRFGSTIKCSSHYPGNPQKGSLGCSIVHLQALCHRRNFFSEKEYLPSDDRKNFGQYDTPFWLAYLVTTNLIKNIVMEDDSFFVDPMAGEGAFIEAALHAWICSKAKAKTIQNHPLSEQSRQLQTTIKNRDFGPLFGVEIDKKRSHLLTNNLSSLLKVHGMRPYAATKNMNFFDVRIEGNLNFRKAIFVGNPCWDVIEKSTSIRSRSIAEALVPKRNTSCLIEARENVLKNIRNYSKLSLGPSECRNIYILTILHCMHLSREQAPIAFLVPKGILGDQNTATIRQHLRNAETTVFVEEFRNKLNGARIFPAVDARVQFCSLAIIRSSVSLPGLYCRSHDPCFSKEQLAFVSWKWIDAFAGEFGQWLTFKSNQEIDVAGKILRFPTLQDNDKLQFMAGTPTKQKNCSVFEGKDIESFRLRKKITNTDVSGNFLFVRKILPNGGKKLIAAPARKRPELSDSLLCVESADSKREIDFLSGVLNSLLGEYRLRLFQSNMNLNLWRLREFNVPAFDNQNTLHLKIASIAVSLERSATPELMKSLNSCVLELYGLQPDDTRIILSRVSYAALEAV